MPRQIIKNYPERAAKRPIICEYTYLGKICAKTSASTLQRALARVPLNVTRYGASRVVIKSRKYGEVLATAKARLSRRTQSISLSIQR